MVYRVFLAFITFLRRVSHLRGRLIRQILANVMKMYSEFGVVVYVQIYGIFVFSFCEAMAPQTCASCGKRFVATFLLKQVFSYFVYWR